MTVTLPGEDKIMELMSFPYLGDQVLGFVRWFSHRSANRELRGPSSVDSEIAAALTDYANEGHMDIKACTLWYVLYSNEWSKALLEVAVST